MDSFCKNKNRLVLGRVPKTKIARTISHPGHGFCHQLTRLATTLLGAEHVEK